MIDILIIGAGPAGLTASIYASRALKKNLVLESTSYGGQIINTLDIDNYPVNAHISGFDFATNLYNQAKDLGAEIVFEKAEKIINKSNYYEVITNKNTYQAKAIIIATGAIPRKLNIPKEEELIGKGISYCATCDGAFYKGKDVAVVGGGDTALEDALYLSNIANKVYLIHRRDQFRGNNKAIKQIQETKNIELVLNSTVTKLESSNDKLSSIEVTNNNNNKRIIPIEGLFIAIGRIPQNTDFNNILDLDDFGYAKAEENCHTKTKGIFVAGDNRTKLLRQLVTATSDGAMAATEAIKYLEND